jgi:hypothetical protein
LRELTVKPNERALSVPLLVVVIACFCRRLYTPGLLSADISNDGLSCVIDVNMLDPDILVTAVTQATERLDLNREGSHETAMRRPLSRRMTGRIPRQPGKSGSTARSITNGP